jgi:threonine/homoserine/homoserine lactone efflux protein
MSIDLFLALVVFAFVTSITPGPNNLMLLASGMNFGFRRSVSHMLGISGGFGLMIVVVGLGVGQLFESIPMLYDGLRIVSGLYMLWLAWKIATSGPVADGIERSRPMTFLQAALFQWVNPKAWVMALAAIATYSIAGAYLASLAMIAVVFSIVNLPTISVWAIAGTGLRTVLRDPTILRAFNIGMAVLLVLSLWPLLKETPV